ncbi:MAG TPA: hypothetical protein VK966_00815, partial [Longimicrobiales bacterium]|nr:hypothetical protein [Longimicrobiales bacterium]
MAPLVVAVAAVATGILLGIYWPVPFAGGPFAFSAGALAFLTLVSSFRERALSAGTILLLLVGAGVLMGTSARGEAEVSCPALMPADTPIRVAGLVESTAGARLRLRLTALGGTDGAIPCDDVVPARFDGEIPPPGTTVSGTGRWWTPNRKGLRAVGSLMLDSLMPDPLTPDPLTPDPLASGPARRAARRADGGARAPGAIEVS